LWRRLAGGIIEGLGLNRDDKGGRLFRCKGLRSGIGVLRRQAGGHGLHGMDGPLDGGEPQGGRATASRFCREAALEHAA
jgi:hypothetical protein